ncbi:MAG: hypothetical protein JSW68_04050 [Burkholderiales bacterium]|nr:MAG: hypothetical protein JSW68_04050 [Burkholderiales bacterium]
MNAGPGPSAATVITTGAGGDASADARALHAAFELAANALIERRRDGEFWSVSCAGEASEFIRINRGRLRQAGRVLRCDATVRAVIDGRQAAQRVTLSGRPDIDVARVADAVSGLRALIDVVPRDPHLSYPEGALRSEARACRAEPAALEVARTVIGEARDQDLVGFVASGTTTRGFADTGGTRHWFETDSTVAYFSLPLPSGRAV